MTAGTRRGGRIRPPQVESRSDHIVVLATDAELRSTGGRMRPPLRVATNLLIQNNFLDPRNMLEAAGFV